MQYSVTKNNQHIAKISFRSSKDAHKFITELTKGTQANTTFASNDSNEITKIGIPMPAGDVLEFTLIEKVKQ